MFLDLMMISLNRAIYRYPEALNYLQLREVTCEDIKKFQIGYNKIISVPEEPENKDWKAFNDECFKGRKIENKIIFPFKDLMGEVIGFVGRSIEAKEFKVFLTDRARFEGFFFGLFEALPYIYQENRVYLVEGPFDLLALSKVLPNSVALLTSKMNDAQYDILTLFCDRIVTVFDSDAGGDKGRLKAERKDKKIVSIDLGFKDPARMLEVLKFKKFQEYVQKKVKRIIL